MREWDKKIFVNDGLYKLTKNTNVEQGVPQTKMGQIDCPAIVQPDLLIALPNGWRAKQGNPALCQLTWLLTNGRQAWEFRESLKKDLHAYLSDSS